MMRILLALCLLIVFKVSATDALDKRMKAEQWDANRPFTLIPHRSNYLMPITYVDGISAELFGQNGAEADNIEAKFQLSLKTPLWTKIYKNNGYLFFAYTQQAYWQAFNSDVSSPFRETNYEPEFMLVFPFFRDREDAATHILGMSLSHQSNGRSGELSRSWNRLKFSWVTSVGNVFVNFSPYYRFKEKAKESPLEPKGDDNPDITKYMGWFEVSAAYKHGDATWRLLVRNNLRSNNKGALQISYSRPFNKHIRFYTELFSGYGESLIDYNRSVSRFGIGFELNDIF